MLKGDLLHQQNYTGSGKIIAVLDSGFLGVETGQPFQRLRDNNQILGGYDYVNESPNFFALDDHGTLVLSTMGGFTDGQLIGTAPDAQYYLYITEDVDSENPVEESNWVEAAEESDRVGADIITSSLGYFGYDKPEYSHTYSDMTGNAAFASKGANIAFDKGIIVVASAGNEGEKIEKHIGIPAEALNVLAVGAVDSNRNYASFSSQGPSADGRVKPDVMAQGKASVLSDVSGAITTANGTSFSCPILAGMVACFWQAFPTKTNQEIKQLVIQSAYNYSPIIEDRIKYGYGIPDFSLALADGLSVLDFSKNDFVVFPNPTSDSISVALAQGFDTVTVVFYTVLGQKVLEKKVSTQSPVISIKSLEKGIYLYKIVSNGFSKNGKIVKK
jgi:subtilisin family serine protease